MTREKFRAIEGFDAIIYHLATFRETKSSAAMPSS
jgi:hypothetical protein